MHILTVENKTYNLNELPDVIDDIRYCILDATDKNNIDYYFLPLVFLESFNAPAVVLQIGPHTVQMPLDWNVLIGDPEHGMMEILPLTNLNDRGFHTLLYNPLTGFKPNWFPIQIVNVYVEVKWYFPKLKQGHMLAMPIDNKKDRPECSFFVKELNKLPDVIDIGDLII